jgi:hypothetical protein
MNTNDKCRFYQSKHGLLLQKIKECFVSDAYCVNLCTHFEKWYKDKVHCKYQDFDAKLEEILK